MSPGRQVLLSGAFVSEEFCVTLQLVTVALLGMSPGRQVLLSGAFVLEEFKYESLELVSMVFLGTEVTFLNYKEKHKFFDQTCNGE